MPMRTLARHLPTFSSRSSVLPPRAFGHHDFLVVALQRVCRQIGAPRGTRRWLLRFTLLLLVLLLLLLLAGQQQQQPAAAFVATLPTASAPYACRLPLAACLALAACCSLRGASPCLAACWFGSCCRGFALLAGHFCFLLPIAGCSFISVSFLCLVSCRRSPDRCWRSHPRCRNYGR